MYNKDDFNNLFWNPFENPKGVRKLWNTLNLYKEFQLNIGDINEDLFFNYMEMVYHKDCVMVKDFENIYDRKTKAIEILTGMDKSKLDKHIINLIDGKNLNANKMIIRFCTIQKSQEYSLLVVSTTAYDRLLFRMQEQSEEDDIDKAVMNTQKSQKDLYEMLKRINDMKKNIFMSDRAVESEVDEEFLGHARIEGFTEKIVKGKIKVHK